MIARATLALLLAGPALGGAVMALPGEAQAHTRKHVAPPLQTRDGHAADRSSVQALSRRNRKTGAAVASRHVGRRDAPAVVANLDDGLAYDTPRDNAGRPVVTQVSFSGIGQGFHAGTFQTGTASWYGGRAWVGRRMSDGNRYDENALTAAHASLPLGSHVRVVLADSDRAVVVTITDRPGTRTRVIDLSRGAAAALGILARGVATVRLEPL